MTGEERDVLDTLVQVANGESKGRVTLTKDQCIALMRLYEAEPLYSLFTTPPELTFLLERYRSRRRNVQMNALLITYLGRAADEIVKLHVGRRMALGLLAMIDLEVRQRAVALADKWRRQRMGD